MMIASTCARSAANIVFFNADEVPLFDVHIKSASRSSTKEIVTIPPIGGSKQDWNKIVRCNRGTEWENLIFHKNHSTNLICYLA